MVIISVHLTMTYRDNPGRNVFKHFYCCSPPFVTLLDKDPEPEISTDAGAAPVGRSNEVWLRCARLFQNVNRGIRDH